MSPGRGPTDPADPTGVATGPTGPTGVATGPAGPAGPGTGGPLLSVERLSVKVQGRSDRRLVAGVSFDVQPGEVVALVGESGSGKSTVCYSVIRLLAANLEIAGGRIVFDGTDLASVSERAMARIRGAQIGVVFQDPLAALDPVRRIGRQLAESRLIHGIDRRADAGGWATRTLRSLGFQRPEDAVHSYPCFFSGGMRQRVCVGIAFSAEPRLVIADEPTTSLDVSLQGRLLRLLLEQRDRYGAAIILVSHDVSVVRAVADRVVVMYGGHALESGPVADVLGRPASPYTKALLDSVPTLDAGRRGRPLPTIEVQRPLDVRPGCPFAARCPNMTEQCLAGFPPATTLGDGRTVHCWNPVAA